MWVVFVKLGIVIDGEEAYDIYGPYATVEEACEKADSFKCLKARLHLLHT